MKCCMVFVLATTVAVFLEQVSHIFFIVAVFLRQQGMLLSPPLLLDGDRSVDPIICTLLFDSLCSGGRKGIYYRWDDNLG